MEPNTLSERLVLARRRRFLTQAQLAEQSGVSIVTIARIESENPHEARSPRGSTITKLAKALGVDPGWLAFGESSSDEGKAAA